jgi:hypothetical protein
MKLGKTRDLGVLKRLFLLVSKSTKLLVSGSTELLVLRS